MLGPSQIGVTLHLCSHVTPTMQKQAVDDKCFAFLGTNQQILDMDATSVSQVTMPLFHVAGGFWGMLGLAYGALSVLLREECRTRHGERPPKALVVRAPGAEVTEAEVIEHARAHLAHYKCPTSVDWRDELPRNLRQRPQEGPARALPGGTRAPGQLTRAPGHPPPPVPQVAVTVVVVGANGWPWSQLPVEWPS